MKPILNKTVPLILLLGALLLFPACGRTAPAPADTNADNFGTTDQNGTAKDADTSTLIQDGERITIRSLADWEAFNYDGNFSDNCLMFLTHLIGEGSDFLEFDTVKIRDYTITRDPKAYEQYELYFEFTVAESELDTLPSGAYRALIRDTVDCFMEFLDEDPRDSHQEITLPEAGEKFYRMLNTWIGSSYVWDCPAYGQDMDILALCNFICRQYGDSEEIELDAFLRLAKDKFGAVPSEAQLADLAPLMYIKDGIQMIQTGGIGGNTRYQITGYKNENGVHSITVQYYAECNAFIRSHLVEYRITDDEKWLGYEILSKSPYNPYGLRALFD